ncbi:MAG: VWA domain-containing protein [Cyclobacteriaceae bacterium]|nr:VWA domain-containing protein [Cyclobacteriaceae bacterium]
MSFFREPGWFEWLVMVGFVVSYVLYLSRIYRIGQRLRSSASSVWLKAPFRVLAFILLIVALLGPTFGESRKEIKSVGKDIIFCVDLSRSMDGFDIQPSRLEKVKFEMKRIVDAFASDRLGIVIYSSEAFMQCPLTFDQNALNLFIETMNTGLVPATGTDFGPPLSMALKKLTEEDKGTTNQKSKIIILISDGEDFGEDTQDILSEIEEKNIRLFTLGVGTAKGSPINGPRGYRTDESGNTIITRLNAASMKDLASKTDGQYFEINEGQNDVAKLINTIGKIEGELRDTKFVDASANRYFYFLLGALVLLVFDALINVRTVVV